MVRAHEAPNLSPLGNLLTLDLEPCPYSHILLSSTTIASVSLTCSLDRRKRSFGESYSLLHCPCTRHFTQPPQTDFCNARPGVRMSVCPFSFPPRPDMLLAVFGSPPEGETRKPNDLDNCILCRGASTSCPCPCLVACRRVDHTGHIKACLPGSASSDHLPSPLSLGLQGSPLS